MKKTFHVKTPFGIKIVKAINGANAKAKVEKRLAKIYQNRGYMSKKRKVLGKEIYVLY